MSYMQHIEREICVYPLLIYIQGTVNDAIQNNTDYSALLTCGSIIIPAFFFLVRSHHIWTWFWIWTHAHKVLQHILFCLCVAQINCTRKLVRSILFFFLYRSGLACYQRRYKYTNCFFVVLLSLLSFLSIDSTSIHNHISHKTLSLLFMLFFTLHFEREGERESAFAWTHRSVAANILFECARCIRICI